MPDHVSLPVFHLREQGLQVGQFTRPADEMAQHALTALCQGRARQIETENLEGGNRIGHAFQVERR